MRFLLFICIILSLSAQEKVETQLQAPKISLDYIKSLKKGLNRDFYINEYLKTNIRANEAYETLGLMDDMNQKMFFNFVKKINDDQITAVVECMHMKIKDLLSSYDDCIAAGLTLKKASSLSSLDLEILIQKVSPKYPILTNALKVMSSPIPFTKLTIQKKESFYNIFLNVSKDFREKYFDYRIPKKTIQRLFLDKKNFNKLLRIILEDEKLKRVSKSFVNIDDTNTQADTSFLLALNFLKLNNRNKAILYLENALKKSNSALRDKILFWNYLVSKDKKYLQELINSNDLNFYAFYAQEILNKSFNGLSFLITSESFNKYIAIYGIKRVALLYSLASVKSDFQVNKISKNFDIGIMQLNAKILKTIHLKTHNQYNLLEQFDINTSIKDANFYLDKLEQKYKNPILLFLAYENKKLAIKELKTIKKFDLDDYTFFMKFELLNNSKEIKNFILYYYLYNNLLSENIKAKITISSIFQNLVQQNAPSH